MNIVIYLAFLFIYIVCFYFMYVKHTELISLIVLCVLNAIFLAYNVDAVNQFFSAGFVNKNLYVSMFSLGASCSSLFMGFIGMLLVVMTSVYIQYNYQLKNGQVLDLTAKYKNILSDFKKYFMWGFSLSYLILFMFLYKSDIIQQKGFSLELTLCVLAVSIIMLGVSYYSVTDANDFAKLRQKDFMDTPVATYTVDENIRSPQQTKQISVGAAAAAAAQSSVLKMPTPATNIKPTGKPAPTTTPITTTPSATKYTTTPAPTNQLKGQYDISRNLLSEPKLSYSDFCTLDTPTYNSLISGSNLSFSNKALFTRFRNDCPDKNKSVQLLSKASNAISSSSGVVNDGKSAASNIMQNANPVNVQRDFIAQNAPEVT